MSWIRQPSVSERISHQQIAEFVVDSGDRHGKFPQNGKPDANDQKEQNHDREVSLFGAARKNLLYRVKRTYCDRGIVTARSKKQLATRRLTPSAWGSGVTGTSRSALMAGSIYLFQDQLESANSRLRAGRERAENIRNPRVARCVEFRAPPWRAAPARHPNHRAGRDTGWNSSDHDNRNRPNVFRKPLKFWTPAIQSGRFGVGDGI